MTSKRNYYTHAITMQGRDKKETKGARGVFVFYMQFLPTVVCTWVVCTSALLTLVLELQIANETHSSSSFFSLGTDCKKTFIRRQ